MLQQVMDNGVVGRQRLGRGHVMQFLQILRRDLVAVVINQRRDARVAGADVRAGNSKVNFRNHHVGLLLGLSQRIAHATLRNFKIDDLALADLSRCRLANPQQRERPVRPDFPDRGGDLRAANFKCDDDIA